jgi:hypothetical protein
MKIFGLNITRIKKEPSFWTHVALVSTKRGKKTIFINGREFKDKNFTLDFWVNNERIAQLDQLEYAKRIKERK